MRSHKIRTQLIRFAFFLSGGVALVATFFLFFYVYYRGKEVINASFFLENPSGVPFGTAGGVFPAIIGTLFLGTLSGGIGGLIGISVAVFLTFYSRSRILHGITLGVVTLLSGLPSILFGLVGYTFLIYQLGISKSLLCASISISAMMIPFITIRSKKVLEEKGMHYYRESLTHGLSKQYILRKLVIPYCITDLSGCVALGMSYGMGAVAPILYTGAVMQATIPRTLTSPFMSLSYHLYILANNGYSDAYAYASAFVLLVLLLLLQLLVRGIGLMRRGAQWKTPEIRGRK